MKWPCVDALEPFQDLEERLGITDEVNDIRSKSLGAHPSASFYSQNEPTIDLIRMRACFDKIAERY
jgi:hypothetical protein